jgi:hypothetical protein
MSLLITDVTNKTVTAEQLAEVLLCRVLSYILVDSNCVSTVAAVSTSFCGLVQSPLSWQGGSVILSTADLKEQNGHYRFEALVQHWRFCKQALLEFRGAHTGPQRRMAAQRCLSALAQECQGLSSLCLRNWCVAERGALGVLGSRFPQLRHLELSGCDLISTYEAVLPILKSHPNLESLRASFQPRETAGVSFALAVPKTLKVLGFVRFDNASTLSLLLQRCALEHLWFSPTGQFPDSLATALRAASELLTLSVPTDASEEQCLKITSSCPKLSLLCRMRIGTPAFGTNQLNKDFELLPSGQGVVVRRRGSTAELAGNGALWSPHSFNVAEVSIEKTVPVEPSSCQQASADKPQRAASPIRQTDVKLRRRHEGAAELARVVSLAVAMRRARTGSLPEAIYF